MHPCNRGYRAPNPRIARQTEGLPSSKRGGQSLGKGKNAKCKRRETEDDLLLKTNMLVKKPTYRFPD
jgi:hypothetical protein